MDYIILSFILWLQGDHTLDHKQLWFQADHRLNHIWPRAWSGWNHKLCFFMEHGVSQTEPYMSRVCSTWNHKPLWSRV